MLWTFLQGFSFTHNIASEKLFKYFLRKFSLLVAMKINQTERLEPK